MKCILFIDYLGAGGAQRQLVGLAVMLQKKGYTVKVSTYYDSDFYKAYLDENCVTNELIPGAGNTKKRIWAVRQYFKKERPDCVIAYLETPSLVACAARVLGCKYKLIVSERNTTQFIGLNERVRFFLYHWAEAIVPNSYSQEHFLAGLHPWMKSKLTTVTNYVDLELFRYSIHSRRSVPEIMVAATIRESKNTKGLIEAVKIAKRKGCRFHVSWYGRSDEFSSYLTECEDLIKSEELTDYIELFPKTKAIQSKYQDADYFCLPSYYEGTPNVICEAISTGLPILCSSICDNSIYVKDGINGILFNPKDPENIASGLINILSQSNEEYSSYRCQSRMIAEKLLSKDVFMDKYISIIGRPSND